MSTKYRPQSDVSPCTFIKRTTWPETQCYIFLQSHLDLVNGVWTSGRNEPQGTISVAVLSFRSATRPCGVTARARQKRNECRTYHRISYAPRVIEFVLEHLDGVLDGLHLADEPLERQVVGELDVGPARPGNDNVE